MRATDSEDADMAIADLDRVAKWLISASIKSPATLMANMPFIQQSLDDIEIALGRAKRKMKVTT